MSEYRDFVQDFAGRCQDVLATFLEPARARDREVTLLLMAASGGFVVSYERLQANHTFPQPLLDRERHTAAREKLRGILEQAMDQSTLLKGQNSWRGGTLAAAVCPPDDWPELREPARFPPEAPVAELVRGLRNAMAHGNVLTRSRRTTQITQLVFVYGGTRSAPLRYMLVSPTDLGRFLSEWFAAVGALPLPYQEVLLVVGEAA
jgi:hypothetical protein